MTRFNNNNNNNNMLYRTLISFSCSKPLDMEEIIKTPSGYHNADKNCIHKYKVGYNFLLSLVSRSYTNTVFHEFSFQYTTRVVLNFSN